MSKKKPDWEAEPAELELEELKLAEYFDKHGERSKFDIAKALVVRYQREYERTGNPLHIWHAYGECRDYGLEVPEWILAYLDRVAKDLLIMASEPDKIPKSPAPTVARIMGMNEKGSGNVFRTFQSQDVRDYRMAHDVICDIIADEEKRGSHKLDTIEKAVAKRFEVSKATVDRAYKKYADIISHPEKASFKK